MWRWTIRNSEPWSWPVRVTFDGDMLAVSYGGMSLPYGVVPPDTPDFVVCVGTKPSSQPLTSRWFEAKLKLELRGREDGRWGDWQLKSTKDVLVNVLPEPVLDNAQVGQRIGDYEDFTLVFNGNRPFDGEITLRGDASPTLFQVTPLICPCRSRSKLYVSWHSCTRFSKTVPASVLPIRSVLPDYHELPDPCHGDHCPRPGPLALSPSTRAIPPNTQSLP